MKPTWSSTPPLAAIVPFQPALSTVTFAPAWTTSPFHSCWMACPSRNDHFSVQAAIGALPVLVMRSAASNPLDHWLRTV